MDRSVSDYVVMGTLVGGIGLLFLLALRASQHWAYRLGAMIALASAFLTIWINLAVGLIGEPDESANLLFFGVLVIAFASAAMSGFKARGMAHAMFIAAFAQASVMAVALGFGLGAGPPNWPWVVLVIGGFFAAAFLVAGGLFLLAAREDRARA